MNEKNRILNSGLLEQYVLGLLDAEELRLVEQYLQDYPELQIHLMKLQSTMEQVLQENAIAPPASLKQNILSEVDNLNTTVSRSPTPTNSISLAGVLGSILTVLFASGMYYFYQKNQNTYKNYEQLEQQYELLEANCKRQQAQNQEIQAHYQFIKDPSTQHIHLRGTRLAPEALIVAYLNEEAEHVSIDIVNLPEAPDGKRYHLWADVKGEMKHMGEVKDLRTNLQAMKFIKQAESLNLTLEDAGEVEHPTVTQLYVNGLIG